MPGYHIPGPTCRFYGYPDIDTGTLCRDRSAAPGILGLGHHPFDCLLGSPTFIAPKKAAAPIPEPKKADAEKPKADPKHDASTNIEDLVKAFCTDITAALADLRKARLEKIAKDAAAAAAPASAATPAPTPTPAPTTTPDPKAKPAAGAKPATVPVVTFVLSPGKDGGVRTPAEQAVEVVKGTSWVCWSAHMSDKARHVLMKVDGKVQWDAKVALGDDFDAFKTKWGELMAKHGLKNYKAGDGWAPGDEFHLELPNAKLTQTDERATACLDEYARLTREDGKSRNTKFESDYKTLLKPHIDKYEKPPAGASPTVTPGR